MDDWVESRILSGGIPEYMASPCRRDNLAIPKPLP